MKTIASILTLIASALLLCGCAANGTKSTTRYNEICESVDGPTAAHEVGDKSESSTDNPKQQGEAVRRTTNPNIYAAGTSAYDIAQARKHLSNVRSHYEFFECQQENRNRDLYDKPLIVTALVAGGAALAKANAYILGGIGLTAGGIATFKSYAHPDVDRDAFLEAYKELTCAYDETHSLPYNVDVERLRYDRQALQAAITTVSAQVSELPTDPAHQSAQEKAVLKAASAALDAGNAAVTAIDESLRDYANLSKTIYKAVDTIDINARSANKTNGTYASFSASIKEAYSAAGKSDAATSDAKKKVDTASGAASVATTVKAEAVSNPKATDKSKRIMRSLFEVSATRLNAPSASTLYTACVDSSGTACDHLQFDSRNIAINSQTGSALRASSVLSDATTSDVSKLVALATIAMQDLPSPSFSDVIANVTACLPKQ